MGELQHSGVAHNANPPGRGSGRYPFGSGKRPFQGITRNRPLSRRLKDNKRKSTTSALTKFKNLYKKHKNKKIDEENAKKEEARKKYEEAIQELKDNKESILASGDAESILKLHKMLPLTNQELNNAISRLGYEETLQSKVPPKKKFSDAFYEAMDTFDKAVTKGTKYTQTGINAYNTLASIYNATPDGKKNPWPTITPSSLFKIEGQSDQNNKNNQGKKKKK